MSRIISDTEMKKYYVDSIEFMERIIKSHDTLYDKTIEDDIKYVAAGLFNKENVAVATYKFSEKDLESIKQIMLRSIDKKVLMTSKADMLMIESFVERVNLKIDLDIFNAETKRINPFALLTLFQKSEKKFLNKIKNDYMKEAIASLESEGKVVSAEAIAAISEVSEIEATKYLKRLESVNKARSSNSKVK